jgi:hypothetical protein
MMTMTQDIFSQLADDIHRHPICSSLEASKPPKMEVYSALDICKAPQLKLQGLGKVEDWAMWIMSPIMAG